MKVLPKVSILVAARNEALAITDCLVALAQLDYPQDRLEILIGNDASTDQTLALIESFIVDKPQFRVYSIQNSYQQLQGKANVLEQLSFEATGEFLFYCDADIQVPTTWVKSMLLHFADHHVGVVNGITIMQPQGLFADLQSTEWLSALGIFRTLSLLKIPITAMGNNMAVRKEAYQHVGGYSQIGFSLVEDYALFKAIVRYGYRFVQAYQPQVIATSVPNSTIISQYKQRKRWMQGAMQLPIVFIVIFVILSLSPLILTLFALAGIDGASVPLALYLLSISMLGLINVLYLQQYRLLYTVAFFGPYLSMMNLLSLYSYFSKGPVQWKERDYSANNH